MNPPSYDSVLRFHLLWFLFCDSPSCDSHNGISPMVTSLLALPSVYMVTEASTLPPLLWVYFGLQYYGSYFDSNASYGPCFSPSPTVTPAQVCTILLMS